MSDFQSRKDQAKERAKQIRREAYLRAKELRKQKLLEEKARPLTAEQQERQQAKKDWARQKRREYYQAAKAAKKAKYAAGKAFENDSDLPSPLTAAQLKLVSYSGSGGKFDPVRELPVVLRLVEDP